MSHFLIFKVFRVCMDVCMYMCIYVSMYVYSSRSSNNDKLNKNTKQDVGIDGRG